MSEHDEEPELLAALNGIAWAEKTEDTNTHIARVLALFDRAAAQLAHEVAQNNIAGQQLVAMADNFERAKTLIGAGNAVSQLAAMTQERDELVGDLLRHDAAQRQTIERLERELEQMKSDAKDACGELMVSLDDSPPGSLVAKLVCANRVLRSERGHLARELTQAQGNYAIQKAAADEAEARWYRTNAQYESVAKAVTRQAGEIAQLNNVLRQAGWGQGEIDSAAYTFDKLAQANRNLVKERDAAVARVRELEAQCAR